MPALDGLRVLDLSRVLAGPYCTQTLADLGATVWKIEPLWGDETRAWGPPFLAPDGEGGFVTAEEGESAYYLTINRNKKSLAINLKDPRGQNLVEQLALKADVLIENYKVGDLARYGLDFERLSNLNPRLIYCSITGFGQTGPRAHEAGYDAALQGYVGIMSVTGEADREPMKVGVAWIDILTGMTASQAILAALFERERSQLGQYLDISLFDVGLSSMANFAQSYLVSDKIPLRRGNSHPQIVPYGTFPTSDGYIVLAIGNDRQYETFCQLIARADLYQCYPTNIIRVKERETLVELLNDITRSKPKAQWLNLLQAAGVPCAPVNTLAEAFADPQTEARGLVQELSHPTLGRLPVLGSPLSNLSRTPAQLKHAPPQLGEHTQEVLQQVLGLESNYIRRLEAEGVVRGC